MPQNDIGGCIVKLREVNYGQLSKLDNLYKRKDQKGVEELLRRCFPVFIEKDGTATIEARIEILKQKKLIGFTLRNLKGHEHFMVVRHNIEFSPGDLDSFRRARLIHHYQNFFPIRFALAIIMVAQENGWNINIQPVQPNSPRMILGIKGLRLDDIKGLTRKDREERSYEQMNPKILAYITKLMRAKIRKV
jgi:hypothetical protein